MPDTCPLKLVGRQAAGLEYFLKTAYAFSIENKIPQKEL
jgi:hypothetical protein